MTSFVRVALCAIVLATAACASGQQTGHSAIDPQPAKQDNSSDDLVKLLRTRSNGLVVTRTANGEIAVQLMHAPTSFYGASMPLYLLDDTPYRPGPDGALIGINPYDIESIKALTKPEETTMYGVRGANGVIVITTKKPGKSQ